MASPRAQQLAQRQDRDRDQVERAAIRGAAGAITRIRADALKAFRDGDDSARLVAELMRDRLPRRMAEAMATADLTGRWRMVIEARRALRRRQNLASIDTLQDRLAGRLKLEPAQLDVLTQLYFGPGAQAVDQAAGAARSTIERTLARLREQDVPVREGVQRLRRAFDDAGLEAAVDRRGRLLNKGHTVETLFRTHTQLAYAAGREQAAKDPVIDEILWGWEYVTVGDDRVRPSHQLMDGTKLPKNDPFWQASTPPNGFNCRCSVIEVFDDDEASEQRPPEGEQEVDGQRARAEPDRGFEFNPGEAFRQRVVLPVE